MASSPFRTAEERKAAGIRTRHLPQKAVLSTSEDRNTWKPTDASGAGLALTINDAKFVRNGKLVFAFFSITYPATASGATAKIGGLPFRPKNTAQEAHPVALAFTGAAVTRAYVHPTDGTLRFLDAGGVTDQVNSAMATKRTGGVAIYEAGEDTQP